MGTVFNGHVFEFMLARTDGACAFYRRVLRTWLASLKLRNAKSLFRNETLREQTAAAYEHWAAGCAWPALDTRHAAAA